MAAPSTPEQPLAVRTVARHVSDWIGRLGAVWVEGQVTGLNRRPGSAKVFFTLRDVAAEVSLSMVAPASAAGPDVVTDGQRVVVLAQPEFYFVRGSLSFAVREIRPVGAGALLARIEALKTLLDQEGLFAAGRKKPLPFLPRRVGLITGRESAAKRDVLDNAARRWPAVEFTVHEVVVQGPGAVAAVVESLRVLDRDPEVDVIVLARGGGSLEDLLPFSDESLCRAVASCFTPVVAAIGHEQDTPLVDFVADVRCSTPTDAGKRVVPDVAEERARVLALRRTAWRCLAGRIQHEAATLAAVRSRPCLADPGRGIERRADEVAALRARAQVVVETCMDRAERDLASCRARVGALSPQATLDRGYAVVQRDDGAVVRSPAEVAAGARLRLRVRDGELAARVER
jgi:exodeoxyribonuclease VII large subunit